MKNVQTNLSNLKSKVDKLDADKLVPVPLDLSKLSDVVKKGLYNAKIKILKIEYLILVTPLLKLLLILK